VIVSVKYKDGEVSSFMKLAISGADKLDCEIVEALKELLSEQKCGIATVHNEFES